MLSHILRSLIEFVYGQHGDLATWRFTIPHDSSTRAHAGWELAIAEIEKLNGTLSQEWLSHVSTGERQNREYLVGREKVLLELDRWNGFTISSETDVVESVIRRLEIEIQSDLSAKQS